MAHQWLALAPPVGVDRDSYYRGDRHDPAALAHLQVRRVEPDIRPGAGERPVQELADPLINVLAELRDRALRDATEAHGLHELIHPAGRDAADPSLLDDSDERLLRRPPRFEKPGEVRSLPQLRHAQVQRSEPGVERPVAVAVAPGRAALGALVAPGPDHALDVGLHEQLQDRLGDGAKEIALVVLLKQLCERHAGLGHRRSLR